MGISTSCYKITLLLKKYQLKKRIICLNTMSSSSYTETIDISDAVDSSSELISLEIWEVWLAKVVQFITSFDRVIDVVGMLGQIKMKIEDCSRCYTGMWTLDMLHECWKNNNMKLKPAFKTGLDVLQADWNLIMGPIRDKRRELIASKCIDFFQANFKEWQKVVSKTMLTNWMSTMSSHDAWMNVCKCAADNGWNEDKQYKKFLAKLLIEMTKY
jgi:hypothetical protein